MIVTFPGYLHIFFTFLLSLSLKGITLQSTYIGMQLTYSRYRVYALQCCELCAKCKTLAQLLSLSIQSVNTFRLETALLLFSVIWLLNQLQ